MVKNNLFKNVRMFFVASAMVLFLLTSCGKENIEKPEVAVNLLNFDVTFYKNHSMNYSIPIKLVSKNEVTKDNLSFETASGKSIAYTIQDHTEEWFTEYDYIVSQKVNWEELATLYKSNINDDMLLFDSKMKEYHEAYESEKTKEDSYYCYDIVLKFLDYSFDNGSDSEIVTEIVMNLNDESYTYDVGNIRFLVAENDENGKLIQWKALARIGKSYVPTKMKMYADDVENGQYEVVEDIEIQSIDSLMEGVNIKEVNVIVQKKSGEIVTKYYSDVSEIQGLQLEKDDFVTFNPTFETAESEEFIYHQSYNYKIVYTYQDEQHETIFESGILNTRDTYYEILMQDVLEEEYRAYFFDYVNVIQN